MPVRDTADPRLESMFGLQDARELGVRPVVRLPRSGPSGWMIAVAAAFAALLLFWTLESRRQVQPEPSVAVRAADSRAYPAEPPPLYIPPAPAPAPQLSPVTAPPPIMAPAPAQSTPAPVTAMPRPQPVYIPQPMANPVPQPLEPPARTASGPALVIDTGGAAPTGAAGPAVAASGMEGADRSWGDRVKASPLANRSTTVPQGMLIPAVLETAFDSTRPGLARAIVSRDVWGFDGSKVLIPRGSRLVGEYGSQVAPGQKRALITWTRLVRPDGMMIAIGSPAGDPLGRGGVRAKVNSHFLERFAGAFLRTTVDLGTGLAMRAATGSVFVALPGSVQTGAVPAQSDQIVPTLKIPAGASISVFVARDLEFTEDGRKP